MMKNLLKLQEHDLERLEAEKQLSKLPKERDSLRRKIDTVKASIDALAGELKEMELARNQADMDLKAAEDKIFKYKTQQMEVKKNEEFAALTQQIEDTKKDISRLEDEELTLMIAIDEKAEKNKEEAAVHEARITELEGEIKILEKQESDYQANIEGIQKAVEAAKEHVDRPYLSKYEQVANNNSKSPYVVPLRDHRCCGCHLKVSNDIASEVRAAASIVQCDSCGRILYIED